MEIIEAPDSMRARTRRGRATGRRVALVPTMGALHAGHQRLIEVAHRHADEVVVSIFVNPIQFNRADDFAAYPRPMEADLAVCERLGAAAVYAPDATTMYPDGFDTHVVPGALAEPMEGVFRPGHFRGVATVVAKLFTAAEPDVAVFGQKDFQQLAVIRRMTADLDIGVEIVSVPTVREPDGLALSSRNVRLDASSRAAAVCVPRALAAAQQAFTAGVRSGDQIQAAALSVLAAEPSARPEYVEVCDPASLRPVAAATHGALVAAAVWFGEVRLIDNVLLGEPAS
ncbi:MAG TPA: pantoate--beta-alanine ligase [Acidimicrobiales bacterium]